MPHPWEEHLNWIVPGRRAVVTSQVDYRRVMEAWRQCLAHEPYKQKMLSWYNVQEDAYTHELGRLSGWPCVFHPETDHPAALQARFVEYADYGEGRVHDTVDIASGFYYVRLWKGPLRVLQEAGSSRQPPNLNERKEVIDPEGHTEFLGGDVLEFPLFKFLRLCGREDLADLNFNGEGSFLLGTSLEENGQAPSSSHQLHDNLLAMKFQLLLDLAVGIYYRSGGPLSVGFSCSVDGNTISSRGMIYGGQFANPVAPHLLQRAGNSDVWAICTNSWGYGSTPEPPPTPLPTPAPDAEHWQWGLGHARNIPAPGSINTWSADHMLTSAWACSPCTLFLTHYLFEVRSPYGLGSVDATVNSERNDLHNHMVKRYGRERGPEAPADPRAVVAANDVTILARSAHEEAIVRLYPPAKLMTEDSLPRHGFLAAYEPLDGAACVEESVENTSSGLLYTFEATGEIGRWFYVRRERNSLVYTVFGARRFHWARVGPSDDVFPGDTQSMHTTTADALANATSATQNLKPLVVFDKRGALVVSGWSDLYAERAVPFPTMAEASGKFMTKAGVQTLIQTAQERLAHPPPHPTPGGSGPTQSYRNHLT